MVDDEQLLQFVDEWLALYPDPRAMREENRKSREKEAAWLARFTPVASYTKPQVRDLIGWKFQTRQLYKDGALAGVEGTQWPHARERIGAALASDSDSEALDMLLGAMGGIRGWGPAMASVILAASQPGRYTIADRRALASLRAIGWMTPGPTAFRRLDWSPYLDCCREISALTQRSMRELDQALWAANGRP